MGLISYLVEEVAKDIVLPTTLGIASTVCNGAIEFLNKYDEKRKVKLLKTKKHERSFLISFMQEDKAFLTSRIKARYYEVRVGEAVVYTIKRVIQKDGSSTVEIRTSDEKIVLGLINERVIKKVPLVRVFVISESQEEVGKVFAKDQVPYKYQDMSGSTWDMAQNGKEFLISKAGKVVAKCKNQGLKLRDNAIIVTYNETQPPEAMLYLSLCLFFVLDSIR